MLIEQRNSLRGEISVPGDKSISHRAIMFGSLAMGTSEISNFSMNEDCLSTIDCFRKMQVGIEILPSNKVRVNGRGLYGLKSPSSPLNAGRSGTTIRLILGVLAGQPFNSTVNRDDSAQKKPVGKVVKSLRQMGANINGRDDGNLCPITVIPSKLKGNTFELSVSDAPIKSSLLIAGLYAESETTVYEPVKSRDHSELMLNYFGADLKINGLKVTTHKIENLYAQSIEIPGDISLAAFFITAGLLVPNADIVIKNVGINPTRTGILDIYKSMGAKIEILNERVVSNEKVADLKVTSSSLQAITLCGDMILRAIDELPIIIVAAAMAKGTTVIKDLSSFKLKELSRVKGLIAELAKMGASIQLTEDSITVEGGKPLRGTIVESSGDRTIAMSLAVAGLIADGETMVRKAQVVDISFPEFFNILNSL